jgi:mRNA-degrading endonuclease RelE of RelBE toxin-antitoxin system
MSEEKRPVIEIRQTRVFEKAFDRLSESHKDLVDLEIGKIEKSPEIGQQKKGDLSHLWVHKFKVDGRETLLGYSWQAHELVIYLLNLGPHENFYRDAKKRRKADLDIMA